MFSYDPNNPMYMMFPGGNFNFPTMNMMGPGKF